MPAKRALEGVRTVRPQPALLPEVKREHMVKSEKIGGASGGGGRALAPRTQEQLIGEM